MATASILNIDKLLAPVSSGAPAGVHLKASPSPAYVALKNLRRQQESRDGGMGDGVRSDWRSVAVAASDLLIRQTKDLEVACWLTQAMARQYGFAGLRDGLKLLRRLEEQFGEALHPQDGEARAGLLAWLAHRPIVSIVLNWPLTEEIDGRTLTRNHWEDSLRLATLSDPKVRQARIQEGWITGEEYNTLAGRSSTEFYIVLGDDIDACLEELEKLEALIAASYPDEDVSLLPLRNALNSCLELVDRRRPPKPAPVPVVEEPDGLFLPAGARGEIEAGTERLEAGTAGPESIEAEDPQIEAAPASPGEARMMEAEPVSAAAMVNPEPGGGEVTDSPPGALEPSSGEPPEDGLRTAAPPEIPFRLTEYPLEHELSESPITSAHAGEPVTPRLEAEETEMPSMTSLEELPQALLRLADFTLREAPAHPWSYLFRRALRWGELRARSPEELATLLEPPTSELRRRLRELYVAQRWEALLVAAEQAVGRPEGRGWLDLQFYVHEALRHLSPSLLSLAMIIRLEVRHLLESLETLPRMELGDGTPAAGPRTRQWIDEEVLAPVPRSAPSLRTGLEVAGEATERKSGGPPSPLRDELATLQRALSSCTHGRERFIRQLEIAERCLVERRPDLARPILAELSEIAESRRLEQWEDPQLCARLWRAQLESEAKSVGAIEQADGRLRQLFERLCRVDITRALDALTPSTVSEVSHGREYPA